MPKKSILGLKAKLTTEVDCDSKKEDANKKT